MKPSLLRNRGFTAGLIPGLIFFATVAGLLYAVSLFLQRGVGYSPERAAVTGFAPAAVGIVIASVACRNLLTRLGRRLSLAASAASAAAWFTAAEARRAPERQRAAEAGVVLGGGDGRRSTRQRPAQGAGELVGG